MKYAISNGGVYFLFFRCKDKNFTFSFLMEIVEYEERSRKIE